MYKIESIKKMIEKMKEIERNLLADLASVKTCISGGNRKIGRVMNVSMAPVLTCGNCSKCKGICYDIKACLQYKQVIPARMRNTVLAKYDRDRYFSEISEKMSRRRKNKFFRWHVAGDILDIDYFARMVDNARKHPDFVIWTYTKMYSIVNEYVRLNGGSMAAAIPENMHIMFSKWDGMPMDNEYDFPVFACKLADGNQDTTEAEFRQMYKCPGNCDICKAAGRGCLVGENTYCDEH